MTSWSAHTPAKIKALMLGVIVATSLLTKEIFAYSLTEDFSPINIEGWTIDLNGGQVANVNGDTVLSAISSQLFPYIYSNSGIVPAGDFEIETRFTINGPHSYGSGLGLSEVLPQNQRIGDMSPADILFQSWTLTNPLRFSIWTSLCPENDRSCPENSYREIAPVRFEFGTYHILKIIFSDNHYKVYIDGVSVGNYYSSHGRIIKYYWAGSPEKTITETLRSSVLLDYLKINSIDNRVPVVLLPGFGGSWDVGAILSGEAGTNWKIPPFIKNYEGIIQSFKNAGYVEGTDLYIFGYDWRKPLGDLADDLNAFINSKNLTKVDLVGHSMGGLVARSYAQEYGTEKVDKILTAGSPHLGLIDMYGLWEGAKVWDGAWWQNALLEITTEVHRNPGETKVSSVRRNSPSIIDLFPTFPFVDFGGSVKTVESMAQKNNFLKTLNDSFAELGGKLTVYWSDDNPTRNKIFTELRNAEDVAEEKWEDGKPILTNTFGMSSGDGTVTRESAVGPFGLGEKMTGWHGDLLANLDNNKKVLTMLGLDSSFASASATTDNRINSFVALLRSPGALEICNKTLTVCGENLGGINFPDYKLFILPGYNQEDLVVKVKEAGLGTYKLYLGNIDESPDWQVREGNLESAGQVDSYNISTQGENVFVQQENTIVFDTLIDKTYGNADFEVSASASSGLRVTFSASGDCQITGNTVKILGAGSCTVTAHQEGNYMYYPATDTSRSFVINKARLTVTADNKTKEYSDPVPLLTYTINGNATGAAKCSTAANRFSPAGEYPIVCTTGTLNSPDYDFDFVNGKLLVNKEKAKIHYIGDRMVFLPGKKNHNTTIELEAKLVQESDWNPGKIDLAKVYFEITPVGSGSVITTNLVKVNRKGNAELDFLLTSPGVYYVKAVVDPTNSYWKAETSKPVKIKVYPPMSKLFSWMRFFDD